MISFLSVLRLPRRSPAEASVPRAPLIRISPAFAKASAGRDFAFLDRHSFSGGGRISGLLLPLLLGVLSGCSHTRLDEATAGLNAGLSQGQPPAFLNGPMVALLTDSPGYSAHLATAPGLAAERTAAPSGQLLCRGTKLIFAPEINRALEKRYRIGPILFVWDAVRNGGFVISEALQGYAPISFNVHRTNVISGSQSRATPNALGAAPMRVSAQIIAGHPCREDLEAVASDDGSLALFRTWRAADLKGLPLRISATNAAPLTVTLSNVRSDPPSAKLFDPPDSFTRYDSAELMMSELIIRRQKLRRRPSTENTLPELINPQGQQRPPGR